METQILVADDTGIASAARLLRQGALVAFPTETVYGLGGRADRVDSIQAIFAVKGRPSTDPLILHMPGPDLTQAVAGGWLAAPLPSLAIPLTKAFWPGPLTLILPRGPKVPPEMTAGRDTVAVRYPAHPGARKLLQAMNIPLAAPSANRFGRISPTDAEAVHAELGGLIPLVLDGGPCAFGLESTVVNLVASLPEILRPGAITAEAMAEVLGIPLRESCFVACMDESQIAPGQLASHYAPHTPVYLSIDPIRKFHPDAFHLLFQMPPGQVPPRTLYLEPGTDQQGLARELYRSLRRADAAGCKIILIDPVPAGKWSAALRDRLTRASSGNAHWDGVGWNLTPRRTS